jgi:hypothetical protein
VREIAENTKFDIRKDNLKSYLQEFAKTRRPSNYKKLMFILQMKWPKYKHGGKISYLLKKYSDIIYQYWLTMIFIFRKASLKIYNPHTISNVDFSIQIVYTFTAEEMTIFQDLIAKYKLNNSANKSLSKENLAVYVLLYPSLALAEPISEIFGPFVFFLQESTHKNLENGDLLVTLKIGARES